jgi:hypothetical protein
MISANDVEGIEDLWLVWSGLAAALDSKCSISITTLELILVPKRLVVDANILKY